MTTEKENETPAEPQAGEAEPTLQPVAATTTTTEPPAGESHEEQSLSLEEARKIRSESANLRKRLKDSEATLADLKAFKDQIEAEKLSADEKQALAVQKKEKQLAELQKEKDDAVRAHQEYKISTEVRLQAAQMHFADLSDASRLLDWSEITYDDDGMPNNLKELLTKLAKAKPYLVSKPTQAPTAGGATSPAQSQTSNNTEITQQYVNDVLGGKIPWESLSPDRRTAILNWKAQHSYRF